MKRTVLLLPALFAAMLASAQCDVVTIPGDLVQTTDIVMSGTYNIGGTFKVPAGVTIYVNPYGNDSCGKLVVNAANIIIEGSINGDFAGYPGGLSGMGATSVTSVTGDEAALTGCHNKDDAGQITLGGGQPGTAGNGSGGGAQGGPGSVGSGPKQQCQNSGDEFGLIGGSGGAGGGGGGSYGGAGGASGNGGDGSAGHSESGISVSTAYSIIPGIGGAGGLGGATYGTTSGNDIDAGSGGAGSGGGGRSFYQGDNGNRGGNGGAAIQLTATDTLIVTGTISANGEDGLAGGKGGNGDETADCCGDACNDCGERTLSAGAGGGAGSGGGSGGGILLQSGYYAQVSGALSAEGGNGGTAGEKGYGANCTYGGNTFCGSNSMSSGDGLWGNEGGAGGGGRIKIFVTDCPQNQINAAHSETGGTSLAGNGNTGTYAVVTSSCPNIAGIEDLQNGVSFSIYPNPATDIIRVKVNAYHFGNQQSELVVMDALGRTVYTAFVNLQENADLSVDVRSYAAGIYTVGFRNANSFSTQIIMKQ